MKLWSTQDFRAPRASPRKYEIAEKVERRARAVIRISDKIAAFAQYESNPTPEEVKAKLVKELLWMSRNFDTVAGSDEEATLIVGVADRLAELGVSYG